MPQNIIEYNELIAAPVEGVFNSEIFKDYKKYALNEHRHLPLKGFVTNIRAAVEIEQVYVTMRANIQFCDFDMTMEGKR
ncbi:MAG: hypothetical protein L0Y73_06440, partial [Candidatus Aminicenantes bacterium]|nr:hypothetical protein [Candidatus Aminicenantes bacterium]